MQSRRPIRQPSAANNLLSAASPGAERPIGAADPSAVLRGQANRGSGGRERSGRGN